MIDTPGRSERRIRELSPAILLPLVGYLLYIPEFAFGHPNPIWASVLLLWALGATLLAWWLTRKESKKWLDFLDRYATEIVIGLMALEGLVFIATNIVQVHSFAVGSAEDSAYYNQVLWNTLHGHFLSGNLQQERLYNPPVSSDLALHLSPILLVLLPIYALFPSFSTLLIIRDVALVAAAWPLFLLARERMGGAAGVAAAMLYLVNPALILQGFEGFNLLQLAPFPFFWALRAFLREEYAGFLGWMVTAIGMREDVAITFAGFGLWALANRRTFKWWAAALGIPILWWGVVVFLVQPAFGHLGNNVYEMASSRGQNSALSLRALLGQPGWILAALRAGGIRYLYRVLRGVAFLPILGWEVLVALPGLAANLFIMQWFPVAGGYLSRLTLLPTCALIGAAVLITSRLAARPDRDLRPFAMVLLVLFPSVSILSGAREAVQWAPLSYFADKHDSAALQEVVRLIPESSSVAAPTYALPILSKRRKLFTLQYFHMYPPTQPDFVLADKNIDRLTANPTLRKRYVELLQGLSKSPDYEEIWQRGEYALFRRRPSK